MRLKLGFYIFAIFLLVARADIYLQHPRGSNNKLNEASNTRKYVLPYCCIAHHPDPLDLFLLLVFFCALHTLNFVFN